MRSFTATAIQSAVFASFLTSSVVFSFQPVAMLVNKAILSAPASIPIIAAIATAEVVDDYEYGAVDAPIGVAFVGGVLAVLTALLPIFLQGGEKAFEEIKERDADTFGKSNNNILNKRK